MSLTLQYIIAAVIVVAAAILLVKSLRRNKCNSCGNCPLADSCAKKPQDKDTKN